MIIKLSNQVHFTPNQPLWQDWSDTEEETIRKEARENAVATSLASLPQVTRTIVLLHLSEGRTFEEIAIELRLEKSLVISRYKQGIRILRKLLTPFASSFYGIKSDKSNCAICTSPHRETIDEIISSKRPEESYRSLFYTLRTRFGVALKSTQTIVGHIKYHS